MKSKRFLTGILGILLVFGLFLTMCTQPSGTDPTTYTVTYNANGANGIVPEELTVDAGTIITVAGQGSLTYTGRTFNGWNTDANGTGTAYAAGSSLTVDANITLYAQWITIINYTVTYNANGASGTAPTAQTAVGGTIITVAGQGSLTYTGRTFNGWNTNAAGTGTEYAAGSSLTVNANTTLYAQWTVITYTVTFNSNEGSPVESQTVNSGESATRPENPTKSGYIFVNWYSDSELTIMYNFSDPVTNNITLYAKWHELEPYTVTIGFLLDAAPVITGPTIYHTSYVPIGDEETPSSATITLENPALYDSINWSIPGTGISESGDSITLDVGITAYNAPGEHALTLEVIIKGVPYSRTINFTVKGTPPSTTSTITIQMYDAYGDGWNSAALRINVNGTNLSNATVSGFYNTYNFTVTTGDVVSIYWVSGNYNNECSFIVYYTDAPPNPDFYTGPLNTQNSVGPTSWSGTNALIYRLRNTMGNISTNTILSSFTVQ